MSQQCLEEEGGAPMGEHPRLYVHVCFHVSIMYAHVIAHVHAG